jgi:hypothetical protein
VAIYQAAKVYVISFANLLKNYYTKTEINTLLDNIVGGGSLTTTKIMEEQSIVARTGKTFTHALDTVDFDYAYLEWNETASEYLKPQFPIVETGRTTTTLSLYSEESVTKFKLMFKTFV